MMTGSTRSADGSPQNDNATARVFSRRALARGCRSGGLACTQSRSSGSSADRERDPRSRPVGAARPCCTLCPGDDPLRSRRDLRPPRRRPLWPTLGGGPQSHRRDLGCDGRIPRCALRRSGLGQTKGWWPARSPDRRGRGGGLALRCLCPARAPLPVQSYQLRAWPHAHFLEALCLCIACLHDAGRGGLRLARPCRPRGRRRQHGRDPIRPDCPRAAGRNHVPATACAAPARPRAAKWIEVDELESLLKEGPGITLIDVRGADEFTGPLGHIADAANLPVGELPKRLAEINALKERPVILICRTDKRSATAAA